MFYVTKKALLNVDHEIAQDLQLVVVSRSVRTELEVRRATLSIRLQGILLRLFLKRNKSLNYDSA